MVQDDARFEGGTSRRASGGRWTSALDLTTVERILAAVAAALSETFPDDLHRRCVFSALGVQALLQIEGVDAALVGGQFAILAVSTDQSRLAMRGFETGHLSHPHYWVEAEDRLIDLSPHLLPHGSEYPIVAMPAIAWDMSAPLPASVRYKAQQRYFTDGSAVLDGTLRAQADTFVTRCKSVFADRPSKPEWSTWLATSYASLIAAVERQDLWACAAKIFEQAAPHDALPF